MLALREQPPAGREALVIRIPPRTNGLRIACALLLGVSWCAQAQFLCLHSFQAEADYKPGRHSTPGYLGVGLRDIDKDTEAQLHLPDRHGAEIVTVDRDAPAGQVGLRARDVLRALNGARIDSSEHLRKMLHSLPPGRQVMLVLIRDGEQLSLPVQLADQAQVAEQAWHLGQADPGFSDRGGAFSLLGSIGVSPLYTGAELDPLSTQLAEFFGVHEGAGLLVRSVNADSPASIAGLRAGDVILRVNSQAVVSRTDWMKQLHENRGRPMLLTVNRNKQQQTITLTTGEVKKKS